MGSVLDRVFCIYGFFNSLYKKGHPLIKVAAVIAILIRTIAILFLTIHTGYSLSKDKFYYHWISDALNILFAAAMIPFIIKDHPDLRAIFRIKEQLDEMMTEGNKLKAQLYDHILFIVWIFAVTLNFWIKYLLPFILDEDNDHIYNFEDYLVEISRTYIHGWIMARLFLHMSVCRKISLVQKQEYTSAESNTRLITEENGPITLIDNSKNNLNKIVLFRQTLNTKHGFLFFLFPVHLVLSTLVTMIFICGNGGLEFFQYNYPMEFCQRLVLFLVFFIAIEIEERSKPNFDQLLRSLYLSIHFDDILVRMFEDVITEFKMSTYTIGNTFEIDIKCMLVILLQFANVLIQTKLVIFLNFLIKF